MVEKKSLSRRVATFIAIKGRRRIGKSRLIEEFSGSFPQKFFFTGIPPTPGITKEMQRNEFVNQMADQGFLGKNLSSELTWLRSRRRRKAMR
ncbi:hypothetical protein [Candidatus Neptunochlamydia vexilliferae]|uniref:hypothetical protein n=1 Tax=Candidatus Neptunichlamydia vexilliferae TaxID=1651774 RepID=UPI001891C2F4|nr:hypothetical protein [Candidatus Neptunochlamydia vexilliferae]